MRIVQRMGGIVLGDLEERPGDEVARDEPVTDLDVAAGPLVGTEVGADEVPLAIDELPLVALLGCFADGRTVVRGAAELRLKESDRITAVVDGLRGLGADIEATEDGFAVAGTGGCGAASWTPAATTGWRCSAPSRAWPRARASRSSGWKRPRCPTLGSPTTSPDCSDADATRTARSPAPAPRPAPDQGDRRGEPPGWRVEPRPTAAARRPRRSRR